jgi:UDP-glucose 4-epimerase
MRILLTGGAGFVGTNVVNELLKEKHQLTIIDNLKTGYHKNIPEGVCFVHMDCSDEKLLTAITEPFDALIHIAGQASKEKSFQDVFYDLNSNQKSTLVLLELCKKMKCKRFIFISTVCVYGGVSNPGLFTETNAPVFDTFYALHKYSSEHYCKLYCEQEQIDYTIFRLTYCILKRTYEVSVTHGSMNKEYRSVPAKDVSVVPVIPPQSNTGRRL